MALPAIFTGLLALHLAILNLAGTMSGVFAGEVLFLLDPVAAADLLLLGAVLQAFWQRLRARRAPTLMGPP